MAPVKAYLGEPSNVQKDQIGDVKSTCIYYDASDSDYSSYQFCFDNGLLTSKSS